MRDRRWEMDGWKRGMEGWKDEVGEGGWRWGLEVRAEGEA